MTFLHFIKSNMNRIFRNKKTEDNRQDVQVPAPKNNLELPRPATSKIDGKHNVDDTSKGLTIPILHSLSEEEELFGTDSLDLELKSPEVVTAGGVEPRLDEGSKLDTPKTPKKSESSNNLTQLPTLGPHPSISKNSSGPAPTVNTKADRLPKRKLKSQSPSLLRVRRNLFPTTKKFKDASWSTPPRVGIKPDKDMEIDPKENQSLNCDTGNKTNTCPIPPLDLLSNHHAHLRNHRLLRISPACFGRLGTMLLI